MKKLVSLITVLTMVMGTMCFQVFADSPNYLAEDFEDGASPFVVQAFYGEKNGTQVQTNKIDGSAEIVDAATEGVGTSGKVLKITGGNNACDAIAPVSITDISKPVVMEARFMHKNLSDGISNLFTLNLNRLSRIREYGILTIRQAVREADLYGFALQQNNNVTHAIGGDNKNGYLVNADSSAFEFEANTWYKMRAVYQLAKTNEALIKLEVYDDTGALLITAENLLHANDVGNTPVPDIIGIGFRADGFSSTTQTLYVDDVFVYDYKAPEAFEVASSYRSVVESTNSITIPFNLGVDSTSLSNVTVTSPNVAVPAITSKTVSGKNLTITFAENLVNDGIYNISLAGVESTIGMTLANTDLTLRIKPAMTDPYIDETFEDGNQLFTIHTNSGGTSSVIDAATEGIGESGKVLKLTADADGLYDAITSVSITDSSKPVVMEARFMTTGTNIGSLFTLNVNANSRTRGWGILSLCKNMSIADDIIGRVLQERNDEYHAIGEDNKNGYLVNADSTPFEFEANTWYKMRAVYQLNNQVAVTKLEVYDASGELVVTAEKLSHKNDIPDSNGLAYRTATISDLGFRVFRGNTLYVDDVFVYDYKIIENYAYSMALIGDTNVLSESYPKQYNKLYDWVINNAENKKIKFLFGLGDISADGYAQYALADANFQNLNERVPFSFVRGEKDSVAKFKEVFPIDRYDDQISGSFDNTMLNTYRKFDAGHQKYLALSLDITASDEVVEWANEVCAANQDRNVIVSTHAYLDADGNTLSDSSLGENVGTDLWNNLIKLHKNITMVVCGHTNTSSVVVSKKTGVNNNEVTQILVNPSEFDATASGAGMVALLCFSEDGKAVELRYYSTVQNIDYSDDNQKSLVVDTVEANPDMYVNFAYTVNTENGVVQQVGDLSMSIKLAEEKGEVIVAVYNSNGRLINSEIYDAKCSLPVVLNNISSGEEVKVMWWSFERGIFPYGSDKWVRTYIVQ